ncbi:LOW QUALITY PROTEIN: ribosomal RNA processing protein 1 homolog B-like [Anableps anableps]
MAAVQEPEVQLAQRLASNEKPIRTKAMKKLRKYISARSQRAEGGFTGDELLKLWKGLFYCLWMQDKPLLQEELSNQISSLIHSFHDMDKQLMYLESFLKTFKREWTGIDRLRMDKFYQLVRFIFRQAFDVLRRRSWENSAVGKFWSCLKCHLLHDSEAPSGLLLHILDLYMTELAAVGAAELTADQNLTFIEPFCRKAAKTRNHTLFSAICKSFFSTIIDQAPFAVEDLMKEVKTVEDSDSGQESEEDYRRKAVSRSRAGKQINGSHLKTEQESDDELLHLEDSDTELPDEDIGPVLQFDYAALADKLFGLASRNNTPGHNRQKLYKVIKVLRDLSEGIFPQYPEEVSTDEDDDMFGSRKRMKRPARKDDDEEEEGKPAGKKNKGEKRECNNMEPVSVNNEKMKKKKKKKKKKRRKNAVNCEGGADPKSPGCSEDSVKQSQFSNSEAQLQPSVRRVQPESHTTEVSEPVITEREEQQLSSATSDTPSEAPVPLSGKKKKKKKSLKAEAEVEISAVNSEASGEEYPVASAEVSSHTPGKNKKKHRKAEAKLACDLQGNDVTMTTEVKPAGYDDVSGDHLTSELKKMLDTAASGKKMHKKKIQKMEETQKVVVRLGCTDAEVISGVQNKMIRKKKGKKEVNTDQNKINQTDSESLSAEESTPTPVKRTKNHKGGKMTTMSDRKQLNEVRDSSADPEQPPVEAEVIRSSGKATKTKKRKIPVEFEFEADELEGSTAVNSITGAKNTTKKTKDVSEGLTLQSEKKSKKKNVSRLSGSDFITFQRKPAVPTPLYCKTNGSPSTPASSKKRQLTPRSESKKVTFGLKNNKTAEFKKTDRSLLLSPEGLSRVPFDPQQKPKFGVLKSPPTAVSTGSKKTPKSTKKTPHSSKKTPNFSKKTSPKSLPNTPKRRPLAADFF